AGWVLPIEDPPIADGAVLIGSDGRIVALGPDAHVPRPDGFPSYRFPDPRFFPDWSTPILTWSSPIWPAKWKRTTSRHGSDVSGRSRNSIGSSITLRRPSAA